MTTAIKHVSPAITIFPYAYSQVFDHYSEIGRNSCRTGPHISSCKKDAARFAVDFDMVNTCLRRYETLAQDAQSHNALYIDQVVEQESSYFDDLLHDIDPNIRLDDEQRRAVVADDDYCLLVAGAGAGKTTTMAAKVKYLLYQKSNRGTQGTH